MHYTHITLHNSGFSIQDGRRMWHVYNHVVFNIYSHVLHIKCFVNLTFISVRAFNSKFQIQLTVDSLSTLHHLIIQYWWWVIIVINSAHAAFWLKSRCWSMSLNNLIMERKWSGSRQKLICVPKITPVEDIVLNLFSLKCGTHFGQCHHWEPTVNWLIRALF